MNIRIVSAVLVLVSALAVLAQAERIKGKAKDLKRDIESKQTNKVNVATNAPAKK
jgi:hypothetical protein